MFFCLFFQPGDGLLGWGVAGDGRVQVAGIGEVWRRLEGGSGGGRLGDGNCCAVLSSVFRRSLFDSLRSLGLQFVYVTCMKWRKWGHERLRMERCEGGAGWAV